MDKYEFNIKVEQIKKMVKKEDFVTAMKIADTIDWRRVRNANLLSTISQVYERNGGYSEAKRVLLQAYDRAPIGKRFLYKLTELALKEGSRKEAEDYCREFCRRAPEDPRQYILWYLILKEKKAPSDQRIQILERYINAELDEKWMYELAELYAADGRTDDCVKLCDKMALLFGIGTYVEKAAELKRRYAPPGGYPGRQEQIPGGGYNGYSDIAAQTPEASGYGGNWQSAGNPYGAVPDNYGVDYSYGIGTAYGSGMNYEPEAGYGAVNGYGADYGVEHAYYEAETGSPDNYNYGADSGYGYDGGYGTVAAGNGYETQTVQDAYGGTANGYGVETGYHSGGGYAFANGVAPYGADENYNYNAGGGYGDEQGRGAGEYYDNANAGGYGASNGDLSNIYDPQDDYGRNGNYSVNDSYVNGASYENGAGYGTRGYGGVYPQGSYLQTGSYVVDEEMMADLHQAAAEKELAAEMSRISTEEYAQPDPAPTQTRVFRGKNNIRVFRSRYEEERPFYNRSYMPQHLIVEATTAGEGLEMAVEALKKIHQETGVSNSVIKIAGSRLSRRGIINVSDKLAGKDLIVEEAGNLTQKDLEELQMLLERDETGMIVVLIDDLSHIEYLHQQNPGFINLFQCIRAEKEDSAPVQAAKRDDWVREDAHGQEVPKHAEAEQQPELKPERKPAPVPEMPKPERKPAPVPEMPQPEQKPAPVPEMPQPEQKPAPVPAMPQLEAEQRLAIESGQEAEMKSEMEPEAESQEGVMEQPEPEAENPEEQEPEWRSEREASQEGASGEAPEEEQNDLEEELDGEEESLEPEDEEHQEAEQSDEELYEETSEEEESRGDKKYRDTESIEDDEEMGIEDFTEYAVQYASEIDCSITGKSLLALCQRVDKLEEDGIPLTKANAEEMIEEAADRAEKPSLGGLIKGVFSSKYDKEGLLILKEEHFL